MTDRNHPFHVRSFVVSIDRSFHLARRVCLVGRRRRRWSPNLRYDAEGGGQGGEGSGSRRRREGRGVDRERGGKVRELERPTRLYRRVDHRLCIYLLVRGVLVSFFAWPRRETADGLPSIPLPIPIDRYTHYSGTGR